MADNWEGLTAEAQKKLGGILRRDVAPVVKRLMKKNIDKHVYNVYSPVGKGKGGYDRRGELGDTKNLIDEVEHDSDLFVTSVAQPAPSIFDEKFKAPLDPYESRLLQWIEFGRVPNYFNAKQYPWMEPRPVVSATQEEIESGAEVADAIEKGIKREF